MQRLNISINPVGRLTQLLLLAVTVLSYSVVSMAVANSLFVNHVGAGSLPLAFISIGLCSMPAYALFSQIIADCTTLFLLNRYELSIEPSFRDLHSWPLRVHHVQMQPLQELHDY